MVNLRAGMTRGVGLSAALMLGLSALTGCASDELSDSPAPPTGTFTGPPVAEPIDPVKVAFITDYGNCDEGTAAVADMVHTWDVSAYVTGGDNTQSVDDCIPYEQSVMDYYGDVQIGADGPSFFPALGNHDYTNEGAGLDAYRAAFPYLSSAADDERRWYSQRVGDIDFFILDSEVEGDDLITQQDWLKGALEESSSGAQSAAWQVVVFHRPAFSSGSHGPRPEMQPDNGWHYKEWGADLVLAGHQHIYEDVEVDGLHYLTVGPGAGEMPRPCPAEDERVEGSRICLEGEGAGLISADPNTLQVEYHQPIDGSDTVTDTLTLTQ